MINLLNNTLISYKIKAKCTSFDLINNYDVYTLSLLSGGKVRTLELLSQELALALNYNSKPIFIYENGVVKMIFLVRKEKIPFSSLQKKADEFVAGIDFRGNVVGFDLARTSNMLVAGTTGSGKSAFLNVIINNCMKNVDLTICDPKFVEFVDYKDRFPIIHTAREVIDTLKSLKRIMDGRYDFLASKNTKNIEVFNKTSEHKLNYIIFIIDEFADLYSKNDDFENLLCGLAAKSRACGIHLILSTQRPSIDILTGKIKANFPTRICFRVATSIDSRVVLDRNGAELLRGNGDALLLNEAGLIRFQSAFCE